ncbi:hypothetical protein [Silvibacterium dinghuense]|uniref:Response regulatory domain-containing protein n=1 Tax=Silvibacterium dinghuense TaxID=1560006 RepID=A0A4Q1SBH4_9BACT|nr:hypothetical protein [Silvibacterium dinghuense]RXS94343.1 hypothetical protein ESZ00_14725 [Silvibacterium dinghuense]GGH16768.1 hypothetical protein GCM10011586_38860 [Silvibacterium dinghuense]
MEPVLLITAIEGAESCAAVLARQFQLEVETVSTRRAALHALRRREYALVILDESLLDPSEDGMDTLLRGTGTALAIEINFAISGCGRLVREVRAALDRRQREQELALRAAGEAIESELRELVAGLLLQSQLAAAEPSAPAALAERLRTIVELSRRLGRRLTEMKPGETAAVPARTRTVPQALASVRTM